MTIYFRTPNNAVKKASDIHMGINGVGTKRITSIYYGVTNTGGKEIYSALGGKVALINMKIQRKINFGIFVGQKEIPAEATIDISDPQSEYGIYTADTTNINNIYTKANIIKFFNYNIIYNYYFSNLFYYNCIVPIDKIIFDDNIKNNGVNHFSGNGLFRSTTLTGNISKFKFPIFNRSLSNYNLRQCFYNASSRNLYGSLYIPLQGYDYSTAGLNCIISRFNAPNINVIIDSTNNSARLDWQFTYFSLNSLELKNLDRGKSVTTTYNFNFFQSYMNYFILNGNFNSSFKNGIKLYYLNVKHAKMYLTLYNNASYLFRNGNRMGGFCYLDFSSSSFAVSNIFNNRYSAPYIFYLHVNNKNVADSIKSQVFYQGALVDSNFVALTENTYMPDNNTKVYFGAGENNGGYYSAPSKLYILYD